MMVPEVDPSEDAARRWVLQHHRFDSERRQWRDVVVAAYDNASEFEAAAEAYGRRVRAEIEAGDRDPREHVGGVVLDPGYRAEQARGRLIRDAVRRGVDPRPLLGGGPLPSNVAVFGWDADGLPWSAGGSKPSAPPAG